MRLRHSSRASPARRTTWKGSMTALASGSSSAAALLNPVNPSIATISIFSRQVLGWAASQVLKICLDRPGIISRSREGPLRSRMGVRSKMTVTYLSPWGGVAPHVFIHANDTHPLETIRIIDEHALAFTQDSGVGGIPGHTEGLSDARHRQMVDHQAHQRPAHRRTRELRARISRLAHILAPHMGALQAAVAAHAHVHNRGAPPVRLVRQAPDHRVPYDALAPAASAPPVLTTNTASQHSMVWPNALARHLQPQVIQARERAQIRAIKNSTWACRGLSDGRCRNPHHRKTSTPTPTRHAQPCPQHLHPQL